MPQNIFAEVCKEPTRVSWVENAVCFAKEARAISDGMALAF